MKAGERVFLIFALFILVISPYAGRGDSSSDRVRLERGDILLGYEKSPNGELRMVVARLLIEAPNDLVWSVITDYHHYVDFLPGIEESRLIRREGPQAWQYLRYPNIWPMPDLDCTLLILEDRESGRISFQMIGGEISGQYGSWKLEKYGGSPERTLATHKLYMDFGNLSPAFSKEWSNRGMVYDNLKAFRERVDFEKLKNAGEPEEVMKPSWRKALFWWERDGEKEQP